MATTPSAVPADLAAKAAAALASKDASPAPAEKSYHCHVPNSTFIMPNGNRLRFAGNTYFTSDPDEQRELDAICDISTITAGIKGATPEEQQLLTQTQTALSQAAASAQKALTDELMKAAS